MFGVLHQLASKSLWRTFLGLIILTIAPQALGARPAPKALVEQFLAKQQLNSIQFLEANLDNFQAIYKCLVDEKKCSKAKVIIDSPKGNVELNFDQSGLFGFIDERIFEYRILVGLYSYSAIKAGLALGRGRMSITPIGGAGAMIYETHSNYGKEEWAYIQSLRDSEIREIQDFNEFSTSSSFDFGEASTKGMNSMIGSQISSMLSNFPFLKFVMKSQPNLGDIKKAVKRVVDVYVRSLTHVVTLDKKDLHELFGFVATLNMTLQQFSRQEKERIEEHFQYLEESNTVLKQIIDVVTNWYFITMVVCWTAAVVLPPVAVICGAIGIGFAIPGMAKLIEQANRLEDFVSTGKFDRDIYSKYMVGVLLSAGMYMVWAKASIPSFARNLKSVRSKTQEVIQKIRLDRKTAFGGGKDFLIGEWAIVKDYFKYYLKDLGSDEVVNSIMQTMGDVGLKTLFPNLTRSFQQTLVRVNARNPRLFLYSDFLKVTSNAL